MFVLTPMATKVKPVCGRTPSRGAESRRAVRPECG